MSKSKTEPVAMTDMFRQAREVMMFNPTIAPQMEHFWEAQDSILTETEAFTQHWFERRHAATRTALDAARQLMGNGTPDPADAMKTLTNWQQHSVERIAEDFREWFELCSTCAGLLTRAEQEAASDSLETATKRAKAVTRKEKCTPV